MKSITRTASVVFCLSFFLISTDASANPYAQSASDPMQALNVFFRATYAQARQNVLEHSGPIIVATGNRLILIDQGQRTVGTTVDRAYHDLKTVAHTPIAVYCALAREPDGTLKEEAAQRLQSVLPLIDGALGAFEGGVYDAEDTPRQQAVLEGCKQFVKGVLRSGRVSRSELIGFIRQNVGHAQENLDRATAYRIDNYHAQAMAWRAELGPEKWAAMRVVIPGSSMARRHSLTTQYFAKLLGEPGESDRIVYAESLFDEQKALDRLGTHLFDTQIGEDFFSDRWRMHRDALGASAAHYLDGLSMD